MNFFNSKLSYEVQDLLQIKSSHVKDLQTIKIAGHQDKMKKHHELSFEERISMRCDKEAKELIRD